MTGLLGKFVADRVSSSERSNEFHVLWVPWKRALHEVARDRSALFFPLTKTAEREKQYNWIVKLANYDCWLYAVNPEVRIDQLSDLKKYKVGVLGGSLREQELQKHMGLDSKNIEPMTEDVSNFKKLTTGRIQIWATQQPVIDMAIQKAKHAGEAKGITARPLKKLLDQEMWLVGNKEMPDRELAMVKDVFLSHGKKKGREALSFRNFIAYLDWIRN
jgi:ABC-type amino acid transport substrate-binding protein